MKIEVLVKPVGKRNSRGSRWVIVAVNTVTDQPVDEATIRYNRSAAIRERNKRCEYWAGQDGVETVIASPVPEGN